VSVLIRQLKRPAKPRLSPRLYGVVGLIGAVLLGALLLLALFPQAIAPYDPRELAGRPFLPPGEQFLLGTNDIGQDLLSELIWGTRTSLTTGLVVSLLAVSIGSAVGLASGYFSNVFSAVLLRLIDLTLVLPFLPLVILLSAYLGPGQRNVVLILALVSWAGPARLVRSRVLTMLNRPYIEAARALGSEDWRILFTHVWPGVRTLALVQFVLVAGAAILAEASLSFLGLGDPSTKSWGTMLYFAQASGVFLGDAWRWWVLPAGLMITLSVLSLVLLAYAIEQRLEPGLRG
jgi:ABC-type dipeptide/oligopeptide/nickel transport system permease subunit